MFDFKERIELLYRRSAPCALCPHHCGADRRAGEKGKCRTGKEVSIASATPHFGEEPPLSGTGGSGTIFFSNCTLSCVFCQNYPISQLGNGNPVSVESLSRTMRGLQDKGAHNINFVTPSHVAPQVAEAVFLARHKGLTVPVVYNCGGYEDLDTLRLLDGIVDIYLPDAKYDDDAMAKNYSAAPRYRDVNRLALKEMHRQVGTLRINEKGVAERGLLVRHLVLPDDIAGSEKVLEFIAREISPDTFLSLMAQYHPAHRAGSFPELSRRITPREYRQVLKVVHRLGLENGWQQEL
ncbi:MAG: 4Fe-4S cluster-binding domain-containing protein [Endomicrobiales bacterium]